MSKSNYNSTQDELYEICRLGWQSCLDFLAKFTLLKAFYIAAFVTAKLKAVDDAEALPDDQQRGADPEVRRLKLEKQWQTCMTNWLQLRRYIESAYTNADERKVRLEEAGSKDYEKAANQNWERARSMFKDGLDFINAHTADLTAGNNMPAGFQLTYKTANDAYLPLLTAFLNAEENTSEGAQAKVDANNAIYADLMTMFDDGFFLGRGNTAMQEQFVFEHVKAKVTSPGPASFTLQLAADVTFLPIADALASMQQAGQPAVELKTNAEGKCLFPNLPVGSYTLTITATGFAKQVLTVRIKTGVNSRKKIALAAAQTA